MNIKFERLENTDELTNTIMDWYNNPIIAPFIHVNFNEKEPKKYSYEDVQRELLIKENVHKYIMYVDNLPIGELSITSDFFLLMKKNENSAWISIMIGDQNHWGKGLSILAMEYLEEQCRIMGFNRIELGVFENNIKAINLYKKLGYQEFTRIEHFTYSQGNWCADIRMEKIL